jgi:hypothetical protein
MLRMTKDFDLVRGFDTICLHGGYLPEATTTSRGVPIYRTAPYAFKDTKTAANLFALRELGNIYSTHSYRTVACASIVSLWRARCLVFRLLAHSDGQE